MSDFQIIPDQATDFAFVRRQLEQPPYWSQKKILAWNDAYPKECRNFVTHSYWTETGSVNVFRVVGTDHPEYAGKTWLQLLTNGKRMPVNLQYLQDNPDYYLGPCDRRPRIFYCTVDGIHYLFSPTVCWSNL